MRNNEPIHSTTFSASVNHAFVDSVFGWGLILVCIFSLMDGVMTLELVRMGAWEANPFMRTALQQGPFFFIFTKYGLTAAGFLFLFRNRKIRCFNGKLTVEEIGAGLMMFYLGLLIYEVRIYQIMSA